MVWRAIKRHRKLLLVTGLAFTVLISLKISLTSDMIASTFQNTGDIDGYFRQLLQADMTWNNSGSVQLQIPEIMVELNVTKKTTQKPKPLVKKTDGYNLASRVRAKCSAPSGRFAVHKPKLGTYQSGKTELCIIWKVGTTFVKRLFMMKTLPKYQDLINPYDISFEQDLPGKRSPIAATTRFMFVRDPYQRLVSAYVDKLVAPNPVYWKIISVNAIRQLRKNATRLSQQCGHDLTFREFIQYVILTLDPRVLRKPARPDGHFLIQTDICGPCRVKYDFVGKMETFGLDSIELVRKMQISNKTIDLLQQNGSVLASDDAIRDSCHQPFHAGFKKAYINCISFYEALKRAWLKMQMRGLIGPEEMPLTEAQSTTLTLEQFYQMALKSRDACPSSERKKLQHEHFLKSYSTITPQELEKIRLIYAQDFKLFEYDDRPSELFNS
ncbi:uncharacterized protein LOC128213951 [Mya arenaria]|uniref:uncharacterized protein LOC128213951 n=1 Tax=Mya arenaria TaxID=6604 RepID=UPI0022DF8538|nr:uncharacterized protein LOC128213951 [Mya arenaria]